MGGDSMRILGISLDKSLLDEDSSVVRRMNLYAETLDADLQMLLHTPHQGLKSEQWGRVSIHPTNSLTNLLFPFDAFHLGRRIIKERDVNLIVTQDPHITGLPGLMLSKLYKVPICIHLHGDIIDNKYVNRENLLMNRLLNIIGKFVIRRADGYRVVSQKIKRGLMKLGVEGQRIRSVSTPIDLDFFYEKDEEMIGKFKLEYDLDDEDQHLLFAGRLTAQKNLFFLLDSFHEIERDGLYLLIAGEGEEEKELKEHARKRGLKNVIFLGEISKEMLKAAYYFSDILLLPSYYEGTAKVLKEASACSTPCITTDISGSEEVVEEGKSGYIIKIGEKDAFIKYIEKLLGDYELKERMGKRARKKMRDEREEEGVKKVIEIWRQTAERAFGSAKKEDS